MRVLGPIQVVTTSGCALDLPSASQRRLLARLAVDALRPLRADLLCDVLAVSPGALRTMVSRLRRGFGDGTVVASPGRYRLSAPVDAAMFTAAVSGAGPATDRIGMLERALALWTGPAFEEFASEAWAEAETVRLAELHASAVEDHAAELIAARRWAEATSALGAHVCEHPLRDRPRGLLIQALGGAGRQADALAAFGTYRAYLADRVGTEPSAEVRGIQRQIATRWDGTGEQEEPTRSARPRHEGSSPARANSWLPVQAELARGPALIGRARELELLAAETARVAESGSRTIIVEGEAGIGKTTLLGAFARAVRDEGSAAVLYGRCHDAAAAPLEPFRSMIGHLVEHAPADVLRAHTARHGPHLVRIAPHLAGRVELADLPVSDDPTGRYLLFEAAGDLMTRLAAISPLVVLLDDVQWADPTAVQLLRHLGRALAHAPVLLVLAARDTDERRPAGLRAVLADLERRPGHRICLAGFGDEELAGLAASLLAVDAAAVGPAVPARLREQTAGNPLYATQLVRHWAESGHLALAAAGLEFVDGAAGDEIPANLRNMLWSRVSSLGGKVGEVLAAAAALGTKFPVDAVIDTAGIAGSEAMDALDAAQAAGLLVDVGEEAGTLRFTHVLVARAVYAGLPRGRRRRLHARAGQALAKTARRRQGRLAAQIARQYHLGGMAPEARRWAIAAARLGVRGTDLGDGVTVIARLSPAPVAAPSTTAVRPDTAD